MYQIRCDDYILYDPRDEALSVIEPKCKLKVNTVGEGSFTILPQHPYYDKLKRLRSVFEIRENNKPIFRGRMTNNSRDFDNQLFVDLEGIMGVTNDTMIPPFNFPEDFADAADADNMVQHFLQWILDTHNERVADWQKLKLGNVTVSDPNNYIARSSEQYLPTWEVLRSRLFESSLGGYLCIRYEDDGNYVDYLSGFELTNTQKIVFGENLLDITNQTDATETYSAILPMGKEGLTLAGLPDGDLTDDLVKEGVYIYSRSARAEYGWVCMPTDQSTWEDVEDAVNLQKKGYTLLGETGVMLSNTITAKAVDLHFTDEEIQAFRIYRNILVDSAPHGVKNAVYPLTELDIAIFNPQDTVITIGDTVRTLTEEQNAFSNDTSLKIESMSNNLKNNVDELVQSSVSEYKTEILQECDGIILTALKNYVETGNYESFKQAVETTLSIVAGQIDMNFNTTTEEIAEVDGDLQSKFNEIYKYIRFVDGSIVLGSSESAITLTIENDMISFKKNGVQFGYWDGNDFHTGNIVVEVNERAQFGHFAFIPRPDGSLSFLKVR